MRENEVKGNEINIERDKRRQAKNGTSRFADCYVMQRNRVNKLR